MNTGRRVQEIPSCDIKMSLFVGRDTFSEIGRDMQPTTSLARLWLRAEAGRTVNVHGPNTESSELAGDALGDFAIPVLGPLNFRHTYPNAAIHPRGPIKEVPCLVSAPPELMRVICACCTRTALGTFSLRKICDARGGDHSEGRAAEVLVHTYGAKCVTAIDWITIRRLNAKHQNKHVQKASLKLPRFSGSFHRSVPPYKMCPRSFLRHKTIPPGKLSSKKK
jgi:hypothetical protein